MDRQLSSDDKKKLRTFDIECARDVIKRNLSTDAPRRFFSGVAISSRAKIKGFSFVSAGVRPTSAGILLANHDWRTPIGALRSYKAIGDQLHYTAEVANSSRLQTAEQAWNLLVARRVEGVSIGTGFNSEIQDEDEHVAVVWDLDELSVVETGADPGACILKVWERSHVIQLNRPQETVHWTRV